MTKGTPATSGIDSTNNGSLSFTQMSGSDRKLVVIVHLGNDIGEVTVTDVTLGGTSLTFVGEANNTGVNGWQHLSIWERNNASSGTINVSLSGNAWAVIGYEEYNDCDQGALTATTNTGNNTSATVTVNSVPTDSVMLAGFVHIFSETPPHTLGGGQTSEWDVGETAANNINGCASTVVGSGGNITQTEDIVNTRAWAAGAVILTPVGGGATTRNVATVIPITKEAPDNARKGIYGTNMLVSSVTTNSATYFTGAVTPGNNTLNLLWVFSAGTLLPTQVCSNVATWTQVTEKRIGTTHNISVWRASSGTHANGTIKIGYAASKTGVGYILVDFDRTAAKPSDNGSSAIVNWGSAAATSVTNATVVLSSFGTHQTWDGVAAGWLNLRNQDIVAGPSYTRVGTSGFNTPATGMMAEWKSVGGNISPTCSWSTSGPVAGGIALQLQSDTRIHGRAVSTLIALIKAIVGQVVSGGATVRGIALTIAHGSSVSRLRRLIRALSVLRPETSAVRRIASYKRSVSDVISHASSVIRLRLLPRFVSVVRSATSRVSQRAIYRRFVASIRPATSLVKRSAYYIRKIAYGTPGGSSVRRLRRLLRAIAFSIAQTSRVSRALAFLRTLSVARSATSSVQRLRRLIRAISLVRNQTSLVRRIGSYLRTISRPGAIRAVVRGIGFKARNIATIVAQSSSVNRLQRLLRSVRTVLTASSVVSRVGRYLRTIRTALSILARVSQSKVVGVIQRSVLVLRSQTSTVKRSARYLRVAIALLPATSRVSRVARYLRAVRTQLTKTFSVSRILARIRSVTMSRGAASAVRRSNWFVRTSLRSLGISLLVGRRVSYLRSVVTRLSIRPRLSQALNLGELTLLRVETFLREKDRFVAGANLITKFRSLIAEKIKISQH